MAKSDAPGPGEAQSTGDRRTAPRQAATVILLRGGARMLELLLVKRTERARFMAGVWVFPGGAVDAHDGQGDAAHRRAAVRELGEEAGIVLADPGALVRFSRWITPAGIAIRYDTHFFLALLPPGQEVVIDFEEIVDAGWFTPQGALDAHGRGELELVFPTISHLEQLREFAGADALMAHATDRAIATIRPRVVGCGETARVLLEGEPGDGDPARPTRRI